MAPILASGLRGPMRRQVLPLSALRSMWTRHPCLSSVLDGERMMPFGSWMGLFLMAPRRPSPRGLAALQVRALSMDVLMRPRKS
jgi:hypothetical protein